MPSWNVGWKGLECSRDPSNMVFDPPFRLCDFQRQLLSIRVPVNIFANHRYTSQGVGDFPLNLTRKSLASFKIDRWTSKPKPWIDQ